MISLQHITKIYGKGSNAVSALRDINLEIREGKFTAIVGQSGSGKSTLMHLISALDKATSGVITIGDKEITKLSYDHLADFRNVNIGFVFQAFYLEPAFSVLENVCLPLEIANVNKHIREQKGKEILITLGLESKIHKKANDLSGGEKQRVAIARALINDPEFLLADEPTGNLDSVTSTEIMAILRGIADSGRTVIMVTHSYIDASFADDIITISDGQIESVVWEKVPIDIAIFNHVEEELCVTDAINKDIIAEATHSTTAEDSIVNE